MPVMDEFREERQALKNGTPKEKLSYFFYYYKWHTIVVIAVLALAVSMIYQMVTQKEDALYVALLNVVEAESAPEYRQKFAEYAGIDTDTYNIQFDTSMRIDLSDSSPDENPMASSQKLMVYIAAQEIDVLVGGESAINNYAYNDTFYDLREYLTEEQIARYESSFYYMDRAVARAREEAALTSEDFTDLPEYPSPKNPEAMEDPVPVGIYLDENADIRENYYFLDGEVILSVVINGTNTENASKYIDFVLQ